MFKIQYAIDMVTAISTPNSRRHRAGGWSEGFYDAALLPSVRNNLASLCNRRAQLLPVGYAIVKTRIQAVNPLGTAEVALVNYPGIAGNPGDIPQMALQFSLKSTTSSNSRVIKLAGIPDGRVIEGEYSHDPTFDNSLIAYLSFLAGYSFRGQDTTATLYPIISITPVAGSLTGEADILLEGAADIASGVMVQILKTTNQAKQMVGARVKTSTAGGSGTIRVLNWKLGATVSGKIRAQSFRYYTIATTGIVLPEPKVSTRKIGRPSDGFHGRRSKRR